MPVYKLGNWLIKLLTYLLNCSSDVAERTDGGRALLLNSTIGYAEVINKKRYKTTNRNNYCK